MNNDDEYYHSPVCEWRSDDDGVWHSSCGIAWTLEADGPEENGMNFCPRCGRPLVQKDDSNDEA